MKTSNAADISRLFDDLARAATGKAAPITTAPKAAPEGRCDMCGSPGSNAKHENLLDCVTDMRLKLAALTHDPGYLPPPHVPPLSFREMRDQAYTRWQARTPAQREGLHWVEPTAEEIRRVQRH